MASLIQNHRPTFAGFGPSLLASQARGRIAQNEIPSDRLVARTMLHDHCPLTPGVYGWLDCNEQICYIGKSKSLRKRLLSYFAKTPSYDKAARIRQHSQRLVWEPMSDELLALIREQELIYRWRPDFNTQGQPTRRQPAFVCISSGPAPNAFFTRRLTTKTSVTFGPIAGTGQLRAATESLNQVFRLRDCPDKTKFEFNDQPQLFVNPATAKCIRFELGSCPAPCAGHCSSSGYRQQVDAAIKFLDGRDRTVLLRLETEMAAASAECHFERAAALRDHLSNLQWLSRRLDGLKMARKTFNGVLPIAARNGKTLWLVLRGGQLIGSAAQPTEPNRASTAISFLTQTAAASSPMPDTILEMNLQLIMISWFRKNPLQKKQLLSFDAAIERCHQLVK